MGWDSQLHRAWGFTRGDIELKNWQFCYWVHFVLYVQSFLLRLSGNLPFNSADIAIILQKTLEGAFPLNDKRWKTISEEAKDLVSKLLENNPADRIPLDEALKHPWIKKHRQNRQTGTSLTLSKKLEIEQKDNGKVNPLIYWLIICNNDKLCWNIEYWKGKNLMKFGREWIILIFYLLF